MVCVPGTPKSEKLGSTANNNDLKATHEDGVPLIHTSSTIFLEHRIYHFKIVQHVQEDSSVATRGKQHSPVPE